MAQLDPHQVPLESEHREAVDIAPNELKLALDARNHGNQYPIMLPRVSIDLRRNRGNNPHKVENRR